MPEGNSNTQVTLSSDDASLLSEIENLQLRAREAVGGVLAGIHRSTRRGTSIEFSEHKLYSPGDDIRHMDWRAFAKTDRYHVKQFEDETNLTIELLVDHSGSMGFSSDEHPTKLDYARTLASALSYLALRQGDAAGLVAFAENATTELPPRATSLHWNEILMRLVQLQPRGITSIAKAVDRFAELHRRRSVVFILTDLFDTNPDIALVVRRLAAMRHDITVLHILDPAEIEFPYENPTVFASLEDDRRLFVHPRALRNTFVSEMRRFCEQSARMCAEARVDYHQVSTATDPAKTLGNILRQRALRGTGSTSYRGGDLV